ncbi:hypothetical protein AB0B51_33185 [Streptomyces griseus]|uniref:hypothetical protein n=1 Tax=Streptomyces griseus TaxID=1911 RepID=UPI0004C937DD|nr:hypothetical protein [Streptomyces griseus]
MPIYLPAPAHRNGASDGQGWNRLSVASMGGLAGDECALRPRDYSHLRESQDTRRARYGGYGPCVTAGNCEVCPIFRATPRTLPSLDDRVLVRVHPVDRRPYLMNRPDDGWASLALRWTWQDLARLDGWEIGRRHVDEHGDGFWLNRCTTP